MNTARLKAAQDALTALFGDETIAPLDRRTMLEHLQRDLSAYLDFAYMAEPRAMPSDDPGKYGALCTQARKEAKAVAAILLIFAGKHGSGFSVQAPAPMVPQIPDLLRELATGIESGR